MKPVSVNPIKTSPALGAACALQGIKGATALFHSAPGCTFLSKVILTQHLREPVGVFGTDIKEIPTIMGGWEVLEDRVRDVCRRFKPSIIGVIGTTLSEIRGEDICRIISNFKSQISNPKVLYIPCPDYMGGLSEGYAGAVEAVLEELAEGGSTLREQINILPCASMTIGDVEEVKDIVSSFGLKPIALPDLSISMDGSKAGFSPLPLDGTDIGEIRRMGRSILTLCIGRTMGRAGEILKERFNVPLYSIPIPIGVESTDRFLKVLAEVSGRRVPDRLRRWRARLIDGMIDLHLVLSKRKVSIALEYDLAHGVSNFLIKEAGMETGVIVVPSPFKGDTSFNPLTGDLEVIEEMAGGSDLIITNSHGREVSKRLLIPILFMGFPVWNRFGEPFKVRAGYRGSLNLLFEVGDILIKREVNHEGSLCI